MTAQFSWRAARDTEPSGLIAISADGWMLRLYPIRPFGGDVRGIGWEVRSPDGKSVTGGTTPAIREAKLKVSRVLVEARQNLRASRDPAHVAAFREWQAETRRILDRGHAQP